MASLSGRTIIAAGALLATLGTAQPAFAAGGTITPPIGTFMPERIGIGLSAGLAASLERDEIGAAVPVAAVGYTVKKPDNWRLSYTVLRFATIAQANGANREQETILTRTMVGSIVAGAPKRLGHPLNSGEWMMANGEPSNVHCWITVGISYRNLNFVVGASGPGAPLVYHAPPLPGMPQVLVSHPTCHAVEGMALGTARHLYETAVRYANAHGVH